MTVLRCVDLRLSYSVHGVLTRAVDGVDLDIAAGEFVSVMGPSGCGKSTLLHLLAGLERPDAGEIHVGGTRADVLGEAAWARLRREHLGFVFQAYNLVDNLTVRDNLELPAILAGAGRRAARERATQLLADLGVANKDRSAPATLSGGEQQRVAIARALMNAPSILLADEPTGALDSASTTQVLKLLRQLHRAGQTVLVVTHDPRVATAAQRLLTMRDGRIVDETVLRPGRRKLVLQDLLER